MSHKIINNHIKNNEIKQLYLLFGPEQYLIKYYIGQIKVKLVKQDFEQLNYLYLQEEFAIVNSIVEFCEAFPFMSDKKLIVIKEFDLLSNKKSKSNEEYKERLVNCLSNLPECVHVIFWQEDLNKKSSLYKFLQKSGTVLEFEQLDKPQLANWVVKFLKENGKIININAAGYMIDILEADMQMLKNECLKLSSYLGDRKNVTLNDIDCICPKTLKHKIFEMIDDIAQKNAQGALLKLNDMIILKEPEIKILGLIIWNIRTLLRVKLALSEGIPKDELSKKLDIKFINKYLMQCQNFSLEKLQDALISCSDTDVEMKTKGLDNKLLLEKLIIQIAR